MTEAESLQSTTPDEETVAAEKPKRGKKGKGAGPDETTQSLADTEQRIAAAEARLAEAELRVTDLNDRLLRTTAEYENHRKRSQRETQSAFNNGVCFSAEELLPVLDTLNAAADTPTTDEEYKKGVLLTLAKCEEVFKKLGITEIEAEGHAFDPELHNAMLQKPAEGAESGTVTLVMQKGYKLGDRVVRHAMVAVAP